MRERDSSCCTRLVAGGPLALLAVGGLLVCASPTLAQEPSPIVATPRPTPSDTYGDPQVEGLLTLARDAQSRVAEGLESYEGRMREHMYIGVSGPFFRWERGLIEDDRVAQIRWARDGTRVVRWEGARREIEAAGMSSVDDRGMARDISRELAGRGGGRRGRSPLLPPPLAFDPASDEIAFAGEWVLNPLADTAAHHYRYSSGDTIRITIPGEDRTVVLAEVRVQPRRNEFRLVSASLWFDVADGSLVRAGYRPSRPFDLAVDSDRDVPGFLGPIQAEIRYITIDHGMYDLRWWIPRRYSFEGEATVGSIAAFPVSIEWTLEDVRVNEVTNFVPDQAPEGWIRREVEVERNDRVLMVTVLVPPAAELASSPELPALEEARPPLFNVEEIEELGDRLQSLSAVASFADLGLDWGLRSGMTRYNRVEGLSSGVALSFPLPRNLSIHTQARIGLADRVARGELELRRATTGYTERVSAYRRLDGSSDWSTAHRLGASIGTLLWGGERTPYHRASGVEGVVARDGPRLRGQLRLFGEHQSTAVRTTHAHLARTWNDHVLPENPPATDGWWRGAGLSMRWDLGDAQGMRAFGRTEGELGSGQTDYTRGWTSLGITVPVRRLTVGLEGGIGGSTGELPLQRRFFPGGPSAFRGARVGELAGDAFWFARAELGRSYSGFSVVTFADWIAVGSRDALWDSNPRVALGAGVSILDGLLRLDLARNLRGDRDWRFDLYLDGLL